MPFEIEPSHRAVPSEPALTVRGRRRFVGLRQQQLALGEHVELVDGTPVRACPLGKRPLALGCSAVRDHQCVAELRNAIERVVSTPDHVERQRILDRLRIERDASNADVVSGERHSTGVMGEQPPQNLGELRGHVAPMRTPAPCRDRLELRPPRTETEPEQEPALRQPIERRRLLGEDHGIAVGENDDSGAELDPVGLRRGVGQGDHRFVPARAFRRTDPALGGGGQEVGRPDRFVTEPLRELDALDDVIGRGESAGHEHAFAACRNLDVEARPAHSLHPFTIGIGRSVAP